MKAFALTGDRRSLDMEGEIPVDSAGWLVSRVEHGSDPQVLDIYPYATTSPIYIELPGGLAPDAQDASYFVAWLDRVIADAERRTDYRTDTERKSISSYLRAAREIYAKKAIDPRARRSARGDLR